ncbi:hypothetical protein V5799_008645 [Amblyomma americanum]|uniref:Methyltransferase domain-containing protein n=1 Tax=Amblyomma americanum TaxID=6943 RepID=A0AAQ4FDE3_AMBAM
MVPYLKDKSVLDVGSRLGAMLYAAHAFTPANPIIGVEMNPDLCQIQESAIKHFHMEDRIKVVNANVLSVPDLVSSSDVVILNNVFEFFTPEAEQVTLWQFLRRTIKKGAILVTVPSLEDSLKELQVCACCYYRMNRNKKTKELIHVAFGLISATLKKYRAPTGALRYGTAFIDAESSCCEDC